MLGTPTPEQKKDWNSHVPALVHAYNCMKNAATGFSPYYLLFGREHRLPVDVEFGLQRGSQKGSLSESSYVSQLKMRLRFANNKAKQMAKRQQAKDRELYDQKYRGAELEVGDLVLVNQTACKGGHKIQDRWESEEYLPTPGIPVYTVQGVAGGRTRVLHRNLLLPLQGRVRQQGGIKKEAISGLKMRMKEEMRCPRWLGLPKGGLGGAPNLRQVHTAEGGLWESYSADLDSGASVSWPLSKQKNHSLLAAASSLSPCQGMRIVVRKRCTQIP